MYFYAVNCIYNQKTKKQEYNMTELSTKFKTTLSRFWQVRFFLREDAKTFIYYDLSN